MLLEVNVLNFMSVVTYLKDSLLFDVAVVAVVVDVADMHSIYILRNRIYQDHWVLFQIFHLK